MTSSSFISSLITTPFATLRKSLSARLLLLFVITSLVLVALLTVSVTHGFRSQWQFTIKPHLIQYLDYLTEDIGDPPDQQRAQELARVLPINIYIEGPETHFSTNNTALDLTDLDFHTRRGNRDNRKQRALRRAGMDIGEHGDRTVLRHRAGIHTVYFELLHHRRGPHNDGGAMVALLALLLTLVCCYLILRKMLKPVADISDGVKRMGAGELQYRVPIRSNNDLGTLATSINTMASDIEKMLDAKRQLLLGASHELRSPLTRARLATELLPESNNKRRLTDDLQEMEKLITDLLESEKINQGHAILSKTPTNLHNLARQVCLDLGAPDITNAISPDLPDVLVDQTRIQLLLRNLLSNTLTHADSAQTPAEIHATLEQQPEQTMLTLSVIDYGPGIDAKHIPELTEPFYRTDESRTRTTGGFGLGLHLCKLIAEAHGGSVAIDSIVGKGTTVAVHLPVHSQNP